MLKLVKLYLGRYRPYILLCVFLVLCEVLSELAIPLLMSRIVDKGIPEGDFGYIAANGGLMILLAVAAIFLGAANARFSSIVSQGFAANLRKATFDHTQTFSFSNIDKFSSASLVTRMTNDVTHIQISLMMSLRILTRAPIMLFSALFIAIGINARLSMVIVAAIFLLGISVTLLARTAGKLFAVTQQKLDSLNAAVQENIMAIRVVKAFVREEYEKQKFKKANDGLMEAAMNAGNLMAFVMPIMMLIMSATSLSVYWFGGRFVGEGIMTTGQLMSFISYIMQILMSVMMFAMILIMLTRARASATRILEVLETEADIRDMNVDQPLGVKNGRVEFKSVSFRYTGDSQEKNVLNDINLTIEPGEFIGVVGGTGSGKTSLVSLIPRFYDATEGQIFVDGVNVKDYSQHDLRQGIGMVMQKNNLFSGTIKGNILWGNKNASMEEVISAAKDAQAHNFIESFPKGYDAELGQGGVNVSGGQKQRLCIARAMLKKPPILILDDSTSAVDTATEAMIRKSFYDNFKDSTVIMVAQRISSVQNADRIVVLDDGRISGVGSHEELINTNEIYREIYSSQMEGGLSDAG